MYAMALSELMTVVRTCWFCPIRASHSIAASGSPKRFARKAVSVPDPSARQIAWISLSGPLYESSWFQFVISPR
jgi:hypothetical protein